MSSMQQSGRNKAKSQMVGMPTNELPRLDLSGAEIVRRQFLSHMREPILCIRPDGIQFNNSCLLMMEDVVYIHLMVIRERKLFIIRACEKGDADGQRWCTIKDGERKSRKITGRDACFRLYSMMNWSRAYYYKICGTPALQLGADDELLLVFDLTDAEKYALTAKGRASAGVKDDEIDAAELQMLSEREEEQESRKIEAAIKGEKYKPGKKEREYSPKFDDGSFGTPIEQFKPRVIIPHLPSELRDQMSFFSGDMQMIDSDQGDDNHER